MMRIGALGVMFLALAWCARAYAASFADVDQALSQAREYLYASQKDGNWEPLPKRSETPAQIRSGAGHEWAKSPEGGQWSGQTALVVYALLAAGENPHDPRLEPAIEFLKKQESSGVYAAAMRAQVWLLLPRTNETRALMRKDVAVLDDCLHVQGPFKGLYDYTRAKTLYSLSRSQYGVLGMWAAAQMGEPVKGSYWRLVENAWTNIQKPDGSWKYVEIPNFPATPGITAVGVATLFITQDYLHADKGANCIGNVDSPAIDRGMKWIIDHFDGVATDERYAYDMPYATLYSIERIGAASGLKHFGEIDWYQKGADWLIASQRDDGSWEADTDDIIPTLADTAFAVLFLSRGRSPLVMSKLQYTAPDGAEGTWNQRPRDVANITRFVATAAERELNWQIVNLDGEIDDFFDAPIVYVSGKSPWKPTSEQITKLRTWLEDGGMLLANADCAGAGFAESVQELGRTLFPPYAFRELPDDHPIYTEQQFPRQRWKLRHSVLGLSNGARELIVLIPSGDVGRAWQINQIRGREDVWQLGADLFQYAVDKRNLRLRGQSYRVARDESQKARSELKLARIQYPGNWDPEPGGWRRLASVLWNDSAIDLQVRSIALGAGGLKSAGVSVAHLTGTEEFTLNEAAIAELRAFTDGGGTLIIDSAGGSSAFATSAENLLKILFPDEKLRRLPADDHLYDARIGGTEGQPVLQVSYRPYARARIGVADSTPRLQAIVRGGRIVAYYSREDLSTGLVGQPIDGIIGYEPASATALMSRMLQSLVK